MLKSAAAAAESGRENYNKICELYCREPKLDLCDVNGLEQFPNLPMKFGMVWRFAPMADPLVEEWHCRDLDSNVTQRELAAVLDWQSSRRTYHIMRDHPWHFAPIVGCCFGMKNKFDGLRVTTRTLMIYELHILYKC